MTVGVVVRLVLPAVLPSGAASGRRTALPSGGPNGVLIPADLPRVDPSSGFWSSWLVGLLVLAALAVALLVAGVALWRNGGQRLVLVAALALLALVLSLVPGVLGASFVEWTRTVPAGIANGRTTVPWELGDQRAVPPRAFDALGSPRTTRVSLVLRGEVAGRAGVYAVDGDSGGLVRLDDLPDTTHWDQRTETAVSPNGRFVAAGWPDDDRHTGADSGVMVIDLQTARVWRVPTLQPPYRSAGTAGPSTSLAVLDNGDLVVVRAVNGSLWHYPRGGSRVEFPSFGKVYGVVAQPDNRFIVWRSDPARQSALTTDGAPASAPRPLRFDLVRQDGVILAFGSAQVQFDPAAPERAVSWVSGWHRSAVVGLPLTAPQEVPLAAPDSGGPGSLELGVQPWLESAGQDVAVEGGRIVQRDVDVPDLNAQVSVDLRAAGLVLATGSPIARVERSEPAWSTWDRLPWNGGALACVGLAIVVGVPWRRLRRRTPQRG